MQEYFLNSHTKFLFAAQQLDSFNALWSLDLPWAENLNYGRGGWSGVSRYSFNTSATTPLKLFIKRQQNHCCRNLKNPFKKIPTLNREYNNIQLLNKLSIPTLEVIYYGEQQEKNNKRAVLITRELENFISLQDWLASAPWKHTPELFTTAMQYLAKLINKMHSYRLQHRCLYPKHIFLNIANVMQQQEILDIRLIDLEKMRWQPIHYKLAIRDLDQLINRLPSWQTEARLIFVRAYWQCTANKYLRAYLNRWLKTNSSISRQMP